MQYSIVAIVGLAAVALASPNLNLVEKRASSASVSSSSIPAVVTSLQTQLTGVSNGTAAPTGNLTITSTAKSSTAIAYTNSSITSTKSSTGTTKAATTVTSAATTSKPASTSSSKAGAAPTGVIAAGAMGVVGFFGLALAL